MSWNRHLFYFYIFYSIGVCLRSRLYTVMDCRLLSWPLTPKFKRGRKLELPMKPLLLLNFVKGWRSILSVLKSICLLILFHQIISLSVLFFCFQLQCQYLGLCQSKPYVKTSFQQILQSNPISQVVYS